jgi:murein DD-endopeptidase MepM/ murein hydrolase activator NlpD
VKGISLFSKITFLLISFLAGAACISAKFVPLPPKVVIGVYHPVGKGETLWRICKSYDVDLQEVAELNSIKVASQIKVGDKIFIPGATKRRKVKVYEKEPPKQKVIIKQSQGRFSWPVKGKIVAYFGIKKDGTKYDGIDIRAPLGSPVKAAESGKIAFASTMSGYGNIIIIKHKDKYSTVYAHNLTNLVKEGSWVKRGAIIAQLGNSHNPSASPSLHFQIRRYNKARNPLFYLN